MVSPHGSEKLKYFLNYVCNTHHNILFTTQTKKNIRVPLLDINSYWKQFGSWNHLPKKKANHTNIRPKTRPTSASFKLGSQNWSHLWQEESARRKGSIISSPNSTSKQVGQNTRTSTTPRPHKNRPKKVSSFFLPLKLSSPENTWSI